MNPQMEDSPLQSLAYSDEINPGSFSETHSMIDFSTFDYSIWSYQIYVQGWKITIVDGVPFL